MAFSRVTNQELQEVHSASFVNLLGDSFLEKVETLDDQGHFSRITKYDVNFRSPFSSCQSQISFTARKWKRPRLAFRTLENCPEFPMHVRIFEIYNGFHCSHELLHHAYVFHRVSHMHDKQHSVLWFHDNTIRVPTPHL